MAYSKHLASYPTALVRAAETIVTYGIPIKLECDTEKEAQRLRTKFYGLRSAYLHETNKDHPMHKDAGMLWARAEGKVLVMMPGNIQPDNAMIEGRMEAAIVEAKRKAGLTDV